MSEDNWNLKEQFPIKDKDIETLRKKLIEDFDKVINNWNMPRLKEIINKRFGK